MILHVRKGHLLCQMRQGLLHSISGRLKLFYQRFIDKDKDSKK